MKTISVAIATFNEEKNISRCLDSVLEWVQEIVIVDGYSTDKTIEIAKKYRVKIIKKRNLPIFHINKQKAVDACSGDWILQLDADEIVSSGLKDEIIKIINDNEKFAAYYIPRKNFLLNHWLRKGGAYPDYIVRLFLKGKGHFPCKSVHEQIVVNGKIGYIENSLLHYPYPTFIEYFRKADTYTSLTAKEFKQNKLPISIITKLKYLIVIPTKNFLGLYLRHLGILDGFFGFFWAFFSALRYPISYIKYWKNERL